MEPPDKQSVRVTILSRPYVLRTAGDPREVERVAASVNELMLTIASRAPNADSTHIAVLACLHLADKLRQLETELGQFKAATQKPVIDWLKTKVDQKWIDALLVAVKDAEAKK